MEIIKTDRNTDKLYSYIIVGVASYYMSPRWSQGSGWVLITSLLLLWYYNWLLSHFKASGINKTANTQAINWIGVSPTPVWFKNKDEQRRKTKMEKRVT